MLPEVRLPTRAPFHLEATVRVLQRRPTNRVDVWDQDHYLRAFNTVDGPALVEVRNRGTIDHPDLVYRCLGELSKARQISLAQELASMLGLGVDPTPLRRLAEGEPAMRPAAQALRGLRPPRFADLFETFASVVPFQQLSLDAGMAVLGRIVERFGKSVEHRGRRCHAFPTARSIAAARSTVLQSCGLSSQKARALKAVAKALESGALTEQAIAGMSTADALKRLNQVPGIGPWSAALILLRGFGRLEIFPPGDSGAARGLRALLRTERQPRIDRVIERFGKQRGYLYFCSLGANLLSRGLIRAAPEASRRP
jgi:DNA-3-methyladenine glycosylase II